MKWEKEMMYVITKQLTDRKLLLRNEEGESLVASYSDAFVEHGGRPEVMLFKSDAEGTVTDWVEVYGERYKEGTPVIEAIVSTVDTFNRVGLHEY